MRPQAIINDDPARALVIEWEDGTRQMLGSAALRLQCRCAHCIAERRAGSSLPQPVADIRIVDVRPVGAYALQIVFSDGHARGIFPWSLLRALK
jgi:DUF971 family protein